MKFVHLHTHSEYSLLDGANRIADLVQRAIELEMPALALTDHGCMFGAWEFHSLATRSGLKPILGMEAYVAPGDRRALPRSAARTRGHGDTETRPGGDTAFAASPSRPLARSGELAVERGSAGSPGPPLGERAYYHLILLARDEEGYKNLVKLTSIGYLEGFYRRPRIDREVLARHAGGVIVASACMTGEVARHLLAERWDAAREAAQWYANVFDGRYYLEVQAHETAGQALLNERVFKLAQELGLPVIVTNDAHFLRAEDHDAHDVLLCIGLGKDRDDPSRLRYDRGLYFKSAEEIAAAFPGHPEVLENTLLLADGVNLLLRPQTHVPKFPLPAGFADEVSLLEHLARGGARQRYGEPLPEEVHQRLEYELGVIGRTGYAGYFLIVQDFITWAKAQGIPVGPGRGSAAGSLVAYCLRITDIDPLRFDLLFERFLNPERVSMPDIDVDFCFERRGEVIDYVREKYGRDSVGQIITFGTMKSRAVIRDVGRVLGFEPAETDRLAKAIPSGPAQGLTVAEAVERVPEFRELYHSDARVKQLLDYARVLEGLSRHASVHAAGIVIAPGPLDDYVPVCTQPTRGAGSNGEAAENVLVTQWDMVALEQAGMLKIDFLGLKTLTVIQEAMELIRRGQGALRDPRTGVEWARIEDVPLDDPDVYEMLARGGTAGVFQFESSIGTDTLRAIRCDRFEDLVAANALIRPGPGDSGMTEVFIRRKLGLEPVRYPHPLLGDVLAPTYGVITYQEQVMRIAQLLAGFSLAEADVLRKAVGKKDQELIARELERFVARAVANGVEPRTAREIADQIGTFGRYGFNRSHSVAYALLGYQTAWLKRHYPAEFMAALLSSVVDKTDSVVNYITECRELGRYLPQHPEGIAVLPPDVNESAWKFTPVSAREIRFGLGALRGLGAAAVQCILEARAAGPFLSLFDVVERTDGRVVGKRALEALILAGACDSFGHRAQLLAGLEAALREVQLREEERLAGQVSLFDALDGSSAAGSAARPALALPEVPPWSETERLAREKEILGFFTSGHPLERFRDEVRLFEHVNTANLKEHRGRRVELVCVVTAVSRRLRRRDGGEYGRLTVEDFYGTATVLALGDAWQAHRDVLAQDAALLIRGEVSGRDPDDEAPPIFLESAVPLADLRTSGLLGIELRITGDAAAAADAIRAATIVLKGNPGPAPLFVEWAGAAGNGEQRRRLRSRSLAVAPTEAVMNELRSLFGADGVKLVRG